MKDRKSAAMRVDDSLTHGQAEAGPRRRTFDIRTAPVFFKNKREVTRANPNASIFEPKPVPFHRLTQLIRFLDEIVAYENITTGRSGILDGILHEVEDHLFHSSRIDKERWHA